jgi:phosphomannomutase
VTETLRAGPDPLFGGVNPEPLEANLPGLAQRMRRGGADIGLATDGDGDRIGAFDEKGRFVTPLQIAPFLATRLIAQGRRGEICKTYANTILLDRIAKRNGLPFSVHPIGFKYIAERMEAGGFLIGGEESGGIGVDGYLPERDGLMISLMLLDALAAEGRPLSVLLDEMAEAYGRLHYFRRDLPCPPEKGRLLAQSLKERTPSSVGGMKVTGLDALDGVKLLFGDEGWILVRPSGTEPVLRVYCEAPDERAVAAALDEMLERVRA